MPTKENTLKMGKADIGLLHSNRPTNVEELEFSKIVNCVNSELFDLSMEGKPKDTEALQNRISRFFEIFAYYGLNPTIEGLTIALDYSRQSLSDMINKDNFKPEFADIIRKTKEVIANYDAILAQNNKQNPTVYIFRSKNYYGMSDTQKIEVQAKTEADVPRETSDLVQALPDVPSDAEIIDKKTSE